MTPAPSPGTTQAQNSTKHGAGPISFFLSTLGPISRDEWCPNVGGCSTPRLPVCHTRAHSHARYMHDTCTLIAHPMRCCSCTLATKLQLQHFEPCNGPMQPPFTCPNSPFVNNVNRGQLVSQACYCMAVTGTSPQPGSLQCQFTLRA